MRLIFIGVVPRCSCRDAELERVIRTEDQGRLRTDVGRPGDPRDDPAALDAHRTLEDAADDALLPPDLAFVQLTVGVETGQLGAGAGAARRTVVGVAGTEDEVAAVGGG